jgi:L-erythro-3,5-diaminohexanoate dehydrogenase
VSSLTDALGVARVIEPTGSLPQGALKVDPTLPLQPDEIEVDVEELCLDSTSFRQLVEAYNGDPEAIRFAIAGIVRDRGKMQNPVTGSGGILTGTVRKTGSDYPNPPAIGTRVATLASLTLTPLRLETVLQVDPDSPHIPVIATAFLPATAPIASLPDDVDRTAAIAALDVCNSPSQTRELIDAETRTVLVLGGGHAGLLSLAAARDALSPDGRLVLVDADPVVCERARSLGLCDLALNTDLRDAVRSVEDLEAAGVERADLTVVVVNASDCEAASILLTADHGTVLFFSMATSFTKAALGSEGMASSARMLIGSGYAHDKGAYAIELLRQNPSLQDVLGGSHR